MVGSGLYVLAGEVTRRVAGPSIVISYALAAVAAILSALCYAGIVLRKNIIKSLLRRVDGIEGSMHLDRQIFTM